MDEQQSSKEQKPAQEQQVQPESSAPPVSQPASPAPSQPVAETPKKKSNTLLILVIIFVILLLPCCACGALAMFSRSMVGDTIRETINENLSEDLFEEMIEEGIESESGDDVDLDLDEGQFTWDSEDGSGSVGTVTEWPDSVPSVVPEFTYGEINYAIELDDVSGSGWSMSFENIDDGALASYQADLESAGWTIVGTYSSQGTMTVMAENGTSSISCTCTESDDMCQVIVGETTE